jgi:hypothetical protein
MLGKRCAPENLSLATCSGTAGYGCTTTECAGTSAVDCTLNGTRTLDVGVDCAGIGGANCVPAEAGAPSCAPGPGAAACPVDSPPSCDGTVATMCAGGKETRVDCLAIGLPCDVSQPISPYELTAACTDRGAGACNAADSDTCTNGTVLESCGRGAKFEVNCSKLGLGACKVDGNGRGSCTAPVP